MRFSTKKTLFSALFHSHHCNQIDFITTDVTNIDCRHTFNVEDTTNLISNNRFSALFNFILFCLIVERLIFFLFSAFWCTNNFTNIFVVIFFYVCYELSSWFSNTFCLKNVRLIERRSFLYLGNWNFGLLFRFSISTINATALFGGFVRLMDVIFYKTLRNLLILQSLSRRCRKFIIQF